jgi:FecR protein
MSEEAKRDEEYLWSGQGEPDPEVVRLEALLAPYGHRGTLPALPAREPQRRGRVQTVMPVLAAAASLMLVSAAAWFAFATRPGGWTVQSLQGTPNVAGTAIDGPSRLGIGQLLTTDAQSRARIAVGEVGRVDVEPNSRVRLLESRAGEHRMALDRGRIRAQIWAPPRFFFVNTPSAVAVDLGCAYTLDVDGRGWGLVQVTHGWVAFEYSGRESFIPKDAVCATRPRFGPGTPHYADAAQPLVDGLSILDFSPTENVNRAAALDSVLAAARQRDALTLWHLLSRGTRDERVRVYDRLSALVAAPAGVTRDSVLGGDRRALDAWWNQLGLDSASWWRLWKSPWRDK